MKKETITINLENGLEATPAAMLVQVASRYDSTIYVQSEDGTVKVNAKSIMGIFALDTLSPITVIAHSDAKADAFFEKIKPFTF